MRHIPYQANRCLEVVSKMFSLAEMWGLRPDGTNPRKHIRKYPEEKRERFLSAAELRRIGEVLREMEAEGIELPSAILAARLLILTGCRLNEIMTLKWAHVDLADRVLRLPDSKTGAKIVHLGKPAHQKMVAVEAMDMERLYRHTEGKSRDELAVSLVQSIGRPLPCVHVPDPDADYEYALTAIPGQLIRDLYLRFGTRLLEANVRTFLGANRKKSVNYGIVETLRREPEHFLVLRV